MLITFDKICLVLTYNAEWCTARGVKKEKEGRWRYVHFFSSPNKKAFACNKIICTFAARKVSSAFRKVVGKCRWVRGQPLVSGKRFLRNSLLEPPCCCGEE